MPIEVLNPPPNAAVLNVLGYVTSIRYRAPLDVASQLTKGSFQASVDLSHVQAQPGGAPVDVAVNVFALDRRVQIIDYNPPAVGVRIDPLQTKSLPVTVDYGIVPQGFKVGPPQVAPDTVTVTGASSRVASIHTITARVTIDASGINVNQEAALVALDEQGNEVPGIKIEPPRAQVRISVARDLANATLPVTPTLTGAPAAGYLVTAVTVDPVIVGVAGEASVVTRLPDVATEPIDLSGRTASFATAVAVVAPAGVTIDGQATVRVSVTIGVSTASRTYEVALEPVGAQRRTCCTSCRGRRYWSRSAARRRPSPSSMPQRCTRRSPWRTLDVGSHVVTVGLVAPPDITVSIDPATVEVVVRLVPRPSPSPVESPSGSPLAPTLGP